MRSTIFFILALLAVSQATQVEQFNFAQIEKSSFGETILDLVQINMQALSQSGMKDNDLIDQIQDLVNQLQSDMSDDKKSADSVHSQLSQDYNNKIDSTNTTLLGQRAQLASALDTLERTRAHLAQQQEDLKNDQAVLAQATQDIKDADDANVLALAAFAKKSAELNEAIDACGEALVELAKLGSGSQFVQVNMAKVRSGMQKVEKVLQLHLPSRLSIFKPIISALVDMGTNADPALVNKVVSLINQLKGSLEAQLSEAQSAELLRIDSYNQSRATFVHTQETAQERISAELAAIKADEGVIAVNESLVNQLNVLIPANQQLLDDTIAARDAEQQAYDENNAERVEELATMKKLIEYFAYGANQISGYLRNRVGLVQKRQH